MFAFPNTNNCSANRSFINARRYYKLQAFKRQKKQPHKEYYYVFLLDFLLSAHLFIKYWFKTEHYTNTLKILQKYKGVIRNRKRSMKHNLFCPWNDVINSFNSFEQYFNYFISLSPPFITTLYENLQDNNNNNNNKIKLFSVQRHLRVCPFKRSAAKLFGRVLRGSRTDSGHDHDPCTMHAGA